MRTKVTEMKRGTMSTRPNTRIDKMNVDELKEFVKGVTYDDLLELDGFEIQTIKNFAPGFVDALVNKAPHSDLEERIFYKELFSVELIKEEEEYLNRT